MIGSPRFEKLFSKQRLVFLLQEFYWGFNKRIDLFGCELKIHFDRLRTQEGAALTFNIVYIDPNNPDPTPPRRILRDNGVM